MLQHLWWIWMQYKLATKLFRNKYQYKIVLVCSFAGVFRAGDMEKTIQSLQKTNKNPVYRNNPVVARSKNDSDYAIKLATVINNLSDIDIRVENPWLSIYTNNKSDIDALANLDCDQVKYICEPPATGLKENTIIMPKMDYDFRVTLGKTTSSNLPFVEWALQNKKVKLPKGCILELTRNWSWGGKHFYISGDNNLLMAKMHLGGCIAKVERIAKA